MKIEDVIIASKAIEDKYHRAYLNIIYSGIWLEQESLEPLKQFGLTHPQYNVMRITNGAKEPISIASIQQRMLFKASNVTRILARLLEKGFVVKKTCTIDRRVSYVGMTKEGVEVLTAIHDQIYNKVKELIGKNLSSEEAIVLGNLLDKMRD